MTHSFIYLASQSPRRSQLLTQLRVNHELLLAGAEEDAEALEEMIGGELPLAYVQRVTRAKLVAAQLRLKKRGLPPAPILCSDTTVSLGTDILGKPADAHDALTTLTRLSGRTHCVITAVAVADGVVIREAVNISHVRFLDVPQSDLQRYVDSGEPMGKAGAYAIQSQAAAWISHIEGSYSGIMGLPLCETAQLLRDLGVESSR